MGVVAATAARGTPPSELRNLHISAKQIHQVRKDVTSLDLEQRLAMPGLDQRRADLIVAGAVLLDTLLRRLGAEEITLCDALTIHTSGDAELEVWAASRHLEPFEHLVGKPVRIEVAGAAPAPAPAPRAKSSRSGRASV